MVERKSMEDLIGSLSSGTLAYQLAAMAALPLAAVVVEVLWMLGVAVDSEYEAQLRLAIAARAARRVRRRAEKLAAKTRPVEIPSEAEDDTVLDDIPFEKI